MLVNYYCDLLEMENLERQLKVLKSSLHKHKKEARLWKSRYNQERKARCGIIRQIHYVCLFTE